jgi:hypothetical protein
MNFANIFDAWRLLVAFWAILLPDFYIILSF